MTPAVLTSLTKAQQDRRQAGQAKPSRQPPAEKDKRAREEPSPASAASPPGTGENSLYRIAADGTVREVFREKALMLSLLRQNGQIFVGTGMDGQLFEVNEATKERSEIARLDHGQIHCLCRRKDGSIVLGTGDPGKLYVLRRPLCRQGHRDLGSARRQDHQQVGFAALEGRDAAGHGRSASPSAAATSPSRTKPGATGRPSRPTPSRRRSRRRRPASCSTA